MEIRKIKAQTVCDTVKKLFTDCNYFIGKDIMCALETARDNESSPVGKSVLSQIIENDKIAAREEVPLCQDTGMAVLFVEYGDKVVIEDGSFDEAVNEGVRRAYIDGYLRKSVVNDPVFDRINTKDNTPAIIHTKIVSGNQIKITAGGKGFGSENMSQIKMLTPSKGIEGVKQFILDTVFQNPAYRIAGDRLDRWNLRLVILADLTKDTSGIISYALGLSPHPIPISLPNER